MSSQTDANESLSALLDGEISDADLEHLLSEMDRSPVLGQRWQRLCAVRAAAEGVHLTRGRDICAGVMAAIADAPVPAQDSRVVPLPQRKVARSRREWLPVAGWAAAASLAAVAVVTSMRSPGLAPATAVALAPAAAVQPVAGVAPEQVADDGNAALDPDAQRQLDNLVMEHANFRGGGVGGALGYARFAVHTADYQAGDGQR